QRVRRPVTSALAFGESGSHCSGTNNRQFTAAEAVSVARCALTPIWQLVTFPAVPVYWRATQGEDRPDFRYPVSSKITASGASSVVIRCANRARTGTGSHGELDTNCCRA